LCETAARYKEWAKRELRFIAWVSNWQGHTCEKDTKDQSQIHLTWLDSCNLQEPHKTSQQAATNQKTDRFLILLLGKDSLFNISDSTFITKG